MSDFPAPKYKKGDKVFAADRTYSDEKITCPDCCGTKNWTVVFADGEAVQVDCQTCKRGYEGPYGVIYFKQWKPFVHELNIGEIRFDKEFSYMCVQTGIGSGRLWPEAQLFATHKEAEIQAEADHQENMKSLARNNFSRKFKGKEQIEEMLSSFGFSQQRKYEKLQQFAQWAKLSEIIKPAKSRKQKETEAP